MSSFLKIASGLLLPLALAGAGCVAEPADDDAADRTGEGALAVADTTPSTSSSSTTSSTHCTRTPSTVSGPSGAPLPGPYACAALANGTPTGPTYYPPGYYPGNGYYPGLGYGSGYYPGLGYGPGFNQSFGYAPGFYPGSFGYGPGYYPGFGYPPGYYPGLGAPGPQTTDPNAACGCPAP